MIREKIQLDRLINKDPGWISSAVFISSIADASFLPLPAQTFFLLAAIVYPGKALKLTILATAGTMVGAFLAYFAGHYLFIDQNGDFTGLATFLFNHFPGFSFDTYLKMQSLYAQWNIWILFAASFIAVPFGFFGLTAGVFNISMPGYFITVLVSQLLKYILLSFVVARIGNRIKEILLPRLRPYRLISLVSLLLLLIIT